MTEVKVDIDIIFDSLGGRALVLLNKNGTILKANFDAISLTGHKNKKEVIGKKWDDLYAPMATEGFTLADITGANTGYIAVEINTTTQGALSLEVKVDSIKLSKDFPGEYFLITGVKRQSDNWENMLFKLMKGTEKDFGQDFIKSVTKSLAKTLKVDYAFVGKLNSATETDITTLSFWNKTRYRKNFTYGLAGSPCEDVVNKHQKLISRNVIAEYPEDKGLVKLGVESYFGTPIYYSDGRPLGILVVMDSDYMEENPSSAYILNIFANRIGAEMEWIETQESLRKKDRKLRSVMDAIPNPVFHKNKFGKYVDINQSFRSITGLSEDKIISKKSVSPAIDFDEKKDSALLENPGRVSYESETSLGHYLITKSTILDEHNRVEGIVGSAVDISELKKAELELKTNEEKYRTLFSGANDAIFIMSDDMFIDCNDKTLEMFGCERDEIIGHSPYEFSPATQPDGKDSKVKAIQKINDALAGNSQNFYWKHKKLNGFEFDAEVSLSALYIGSNLYIQAIVRDITEKEQLAHNMVVQNERMEEMYKYISSTSISFREQINNLLEIATKSLGMEVGILSKIENSTYHIIDSFGLSEGSDMSMEVANTYCSITFQNNRLVSITDASNSEYHKHPALARFDSQAYIGAPYWVKGKRYGTLAFLSKEPVSDFQAIDFDYVQMLAQWVGSTLERLQFEENLLERDALLETMLREIPLDFSVRNAELDMVIQSDISKQYWGNNEGKPIDFKDVDERSAKKWRKIFNRVLKGEVIKGEDNVTIYNKPHHFYSIASPVRVKDRVTEVIVINLDISKIKETEHKLKLQNEQLSKLNEELDRFVYSASHDLRAPLASLLGLIDLSSREKIGDPIDHYLELMSKSINTMDRFIADITEYSRNLRLETAAEKIDFKRLFQDSFEHIQFMIPGPGTFTVDIIGEAEFYSDHERLKMVINNLVSNSLRYKSNNRDPKIKFSVVLTPKKALIEVKDNGLGIEEKHLPYVFDMFYRASDKNVGSGLGLFIVKETIEKLMGSVAITSSINKGTTVKIELPNKR